MLIFGSCATNFNKDSKILNDYLLLQFDRPLEDNDITYIIVGNQACASCKRVVYSQVNGRENGYIFILPKDADSIGFTQSNVFIDRSYRLEKLKFHRGNVGKVKVKNKEIISHTVYEPYEMNSIFND
jgi:hypothetical protein